LFAIFSPFPPPPRQPVRQPLKNHKPRPCWPEFQRQTFFLLAFIMLFRPPTSPRRHCFDAQSQAQRIINLQNRRQAGDALPRKSLIKTCTRQTGITGNFGHPLCPGNIAKSLGDKRGISACFLRAGLKTSRRFLRSSKVFRHVMAASNGSSHDGLL